MSGEHTKGPWALRLSDNGTPYITHGKCTDGLEPDLNDLANRICVMPAEISQRYNSYANARLISAAPDLLAALQLAVRQNSHDMLMTGEELRICEAAIAKATGQ